MTTRTPAGQPEQVGGVVVLRVLAALAVMTEQEPDRDARDHEVRQSLQPRGRSLPPLGVHAPDRGHHASDAQDNEPQSGHRDESGAEVGAGDRRERALGVGLPVSPPVDRDRDGQPGQYGVEAGPSEQPEPRCLAGPAVARQSPGSVAEDGRWRWSRRRPAPRRPIVNVAGSQRSLSQVPDAGMMRGGR